MATVLVVDDEIDIKVLFEMCFRREIKHHELNFVFVFSANLLHCKSERKGECTKTQHPGLPL